MPPLTRWFVRASLLHFLFGFTFDALIPAQKGLSFFYPPVWNLFPVHFGLINAGLISRASQLRSCPAILVGCIFEIGAGVVFIIGLSRRVKPHGVL